jgi:hypothetical protein
MADDWGNDPIQKVATPAAGGDWGNDSVVGTKGFKFSDDAINGAIKNSSKVVWMHPDQYLAMTPDLESNPRTDKKGASLQKSLAKGDEVDAVPSLDVSVGKDGTAKVVDQDGRHRAQFAKDAGVDLIPVAVKRSGEKGLITHLESMKPEPSQEQIFDRNKAYAKPEKSYLTTLPASDEAKFQQWVKANKVPFDPSPAADYDMRGYWKALESGDTEHTGTGVNKNDGQLHFSDYFKTPYHKSFSAESQWATKDAPKWNDKDQLIAPDGKVVFDERTKPGVVPFDFKPVLPPQKAQPKPAAATQAPAGAPRWDVLGDIGRSAEGAVDAAGADLKAAFPGAKAVGENTGPLATLGRMGSALKLPADVAGLALSPLTGTAHALAGSALSYIERSQQPSIEVNGIKGANPLSAENRKMVPVDPKAQADADIDQLMMLAAPEKGGSFTKAPPVNALKAQMSEAALKNRAVEKINAKMAADGLTAQQVLDAQKSANAAGDKLTLMDIGKKNLKGLAGSVYRAPGEAGTKIDEFLDTRDKAVSDALTADIHGGIAKGSTFDAMKNLFTARTMASKPAFDAAFDASSLAPFESQFRTELTAATGTKGQIAKQISDIEKNNPGALAARGAAGADVRAKYMDLRQKLDQAETDRQSALKVFQKAKADGTANAPGAVWSPRLQEFMDNPEIQSGLRAALKLEKQDSVSERRPFKDSDFGIVGTDDKGDPIIGTVPTMKSLAVAKEGLDARIADLKDPTTGRPTKSGLSLKKFRDEFVKELYRLNPRYKTAVDAWSGPSQSVDAIKEGKTHFSRPESNEEVKADFDALTSSDKEFYRLGAAEAKIDAVERSADASDKTKKVINNERDRKRFRMLFNSDAEAQKFIDSVERKRTMFDTRTDIKGNSKTAQRQAEDDSEMLEKGLNVVHAGANALSGNWLGALARAARAKKDLGMINDPAFNSELASILTNPNLNIAPSGGLALLHNTPLPGVQNQLAQGIYRAAHVAGVNSVKANALRAMLAGQTPPQQGQ